MARMRVPAIAVGLLLFIGAAMLGLLMFLMMGRHEIGAAWAIMVFLGVLVAALVVSVLRRSNRSRVEQP